jgi:hypothetical protein
MKSEKNGKFPDFTANDLTVDPAILQSLYLSSPNVLGSFQTALSTRLILQGLSLVSSVRLMREVKRAHPGEWGIAFDATAARDGRPINPHFSPGFVHPGFPCRE